MNPAEKTRFGRLYQRHLRALKFQGMSDRTMNVYARASQFAGGRGMRSAKLRVVLQRRPKLGCDLSIEITRLAAGQGDQDTLDVGVAQFSDALL